MWLFFFLQHPCEEWMRELVTRLSPLMRLTDLIHSLGWADPCSYKGRQLPRNADLQRKGQFSLFPAPKRASRSWAAAHTFYTQLWVVTSQTLPLYHHRINEIFRDGGGKEIPNHHSSVLHKKSHTPASFEIGEMVILSRYRKYLINIC